MKSAEATPEVRTAEKPNLGSLSDPSRMRIVDIRPLSDRVMQLALAREDGDGVLFEPGQFCKIAIPGPDGDLWRSYSIATPVISGSPAKTCEIAIAAVPGGAATDYLFTRRVGEILRVSGPFGRLVLPSEESPHYVLVGTGTGMAPYRAMLPELERRADERSIRVTLLMGVRARDELIYGEDFAAFAGRSDQRRFIACYSRDEAGPSGSHEYRGYVQDALRELALTPGQERIYLCGNPDMIDECSRALSERGFAKRDLVREKYSTGKAARS